MSPEHVQKIRAIFEEALQRTFEERGAYLDGACHGDTAVRREVEQLISAHDLTSEWIDRPAAEQLSVSSPSAAALEASQFGPYRVVRELGHGGMGSVYLAERMIGKVRQHVALKVVRPTWLQSAEMIRRFEHEREILASLDHPNIARLLDIGATAEGLPYLVMDYVAGEPIDSYCDNRKLQLAERLTLFRSVCSAVHYAHSKGVVHRDLKPSNILVTDEGVVKLLDFGIAKALNAPGDDTRTVLTHTGWRPLTVEYASPEQIRGEAVTAATDVYSLGVILYNLLTGRGPYNVEGRMVHDIFRAICEDPPVRPSAAVTLALHDHPGVGSNVATSAELASLRGESPAKLRYRLSGDLDSILLKALRKEPQWRYTSADALSEDLHRHLNGLRVSARKDTVRYRLGNVVRRVFYPSRHSFHVNSGLMAGWGMFGAIALIEKQLIVMGLDEVREVPYAFYAMVPIVIWSIREGRRLSAAVHVLPLDRQASIVFGVVLSTLMLLLVLLAGTEVISEKALSIFWNAGLAMAFLILGLQGSRLLTGAGICLLASVVAASLFQDWLYAWLAAGLLIGCVIPGLIHAFRNPDIRDLGSETLTIISR